MLRANIGWKLATLLQRGPVDRKFQVKGVAPYQTFFFSENWAKCSFVRYKSGQIFLKFWSGGRISHFWFDLRCRPLQSGTTVPACDVETECLVFVYLVLCCCTNDKESQWLLCSVESRHRICHAVWTETKLDTAVLERAIHWTYILPAVWLYCSCPTRCNK